MRTLVLAALFLPFSVAAQTCDITVNLKAVSDKDSITNAQTMAGLSSSQVATFVKRGTKVIDTASKVQDRGGPYTVTLGGTTTCPGVTVGAVEVSGVTVQGLARIIREGVKVNEQTTKDSENRGKKHAFAG